MKPLTSRLLVASLLLGGAATFTVTRSFSGGPFDGAGQSGGSPTSGDVQSVLLGQALSADSLTLTHAAPNEDALLLREDTRLRFAPSSVNANAYMYFNGSDGFHMQNQLNMGDGVFITVDNLQSKRASETISLYGAHGLTLVPQSSADACSSGRKGQSTVITSTGRTTYCDGTTNQTVAFILSSVTNIDVPNLNPADTNTQTVTITGALTSDWVNCQPVNGGDWSLLDWHTTITSADTGTISIRNDTGGAVNAAAADIKCVVLR